MLKRFFLEQVRILRGDRKSALVLAMVFCALLTAAILIGVSDNTPGLILCYLAATIPVIALTRTWQRKKSFLILLGASAAGFFVFVFLHNAFYALGTITSDIAVLGHLVEVLGVASFCVAVFLCPATFVVGVVGSIVLAIRGRW